MGKGSGICADRPALGLGSAQTSIDLSPTEYAQLGTERLKQNGQPSAHPYPSAAKWSAIRKYLLRRSKRSNPLLDESMTAYTPGETVGLLRHPTIQSWHQSAVARLPEQYTQIVFVPCAKTKPWVGPGVSASKLYSAYNQLREELPTTCFVTISEPLGIVPMHDWADFPQYDNPGLFRDDAQRSGMTTKQWEASPFGIHYGLPFDNEAHRQCIDTLGSVVGKFLQNHRDRQLIAVVDEATGPVSTHGQMLQAAYEQTGINVSRYAKRAEPRVSPLPYLRTLLHEQAALINSQ